MNRDEAILRELNLYPLWKLRESGTANAAPPVASTNKESGAQPAIPDQPVNIFRPKVDVTVPADSITIPPASLNTDELGDLGWADLKAKVRDCHTCKLRAGCTQTVFGVGDEQADWLFVGEGPGADEDAYGEPFVGQAGKLLDNMLLAIKLKRGNNVYIGNIVKCRPPNNRTPEPNEIAACLPYLRQQIALIKPKLIVALGKTAATSLLGREATLGSLRGRVHEYHDIPLIVTYHPAYLLRTPSDKAKAWDDLQLALNTMQEQAGEAE